MPVVASFWDEAHLVADSREHVTYTGTYKGMPISCTSTGMGCPSTAIAMEELARVGAKTFLRIGTCGTFQDFIRNGDLIVFDSACRYDGTSKIYAPLEYPAAAHYQVVQACADAIRELGFPCHIGTTRSADTFFACHPRPGSSFNGYWQSSWATHFEDLKRMNVYGAEMEASIVLVLGRLWGLRAGGMAYAWITCCMCPTARIPLIPSPSCHIHRTTSKSSPLPDVKPCCGCGKRTARSRLSGGDRSFS